MGEVVEERNGLPGEQGGSVKAGSWQELIQVFEM